MTVYLERITVRLPGTNTCFPDSLASLIAVHGRNEDHVLRLARSVQGFYPEILLDFRSDRPEVITDFTLSDGENISVTVENSTGLSKQSPHTYRSLRVESVTQRLATSGARLVGIDHVGFNLPWFSSDLHPRILELREKLSSVCLYHRYPTGESWDFVLSGDVDEIAGRKTVDYARVRRPKFELVSFDKTSTPLIQFDIGVNIDYESFSRVFPESLNDPEFRNIWIYLQTPYTNDVCLVINEFAERDWSDFFTGFRL